MTFSQTISDEALQIFLASAHEIMSSISDKEIADAAINRELRHGKSILNSRNKCNLPGEDSYFLLYYAFLDNNKLKFVSTHFLDNTIGQELYKLGLRPRYILEQHTDKVDDQLIFYELTEEDYKNYEAKFINNGLSGQVKKVFAS